MFKTFLAIMLAVATLTAPSVAEAGCRGCGCRGGPGIRLANGRCASWRQARGYRPYVRVRRPRLR